MSKLIEGKDGSHMLVSDDTPDDISIGEEQIYGFNPSILPTNLAESTPTSVLLCFVDDAYPIIPIQADTLAIKGDKVKVFGTMLLTDYVWFLEHIKTEVSHLEIRIEDRAFKVASGPLVISKFVGNIEAITVNVILSLSRHI